MEQVTRYWSGNARQAPIYTTAGGTLAPARIGTAPQIWSLVLTNKTSGFPAVPPVLLPLALAALATSAIYPISGAFILAARTSCLLTAQSISSVIPQILFYLRWRHVRAGRLLRSHDSPDDNSVSFAATVSVSGLHSRAPLQR
jgi:hypothetical protein